MLPSTEGRAHRRADEQKRLLRLHLGPCPVPHLFLVAIPGSSVVVAGRQVQLKSWQNAEGRAELGNCGHAWRRVDLAHNGSESFASLACTWMCCLRGCQQCSRSDLRLLVPSHESPDPIASSCSQVGCLPHQRPPHAQLTLRPLLRLPQS